VLGPALTVFGYLVGSVCFGLVYARRFGVDVRAEGSGNVGATNVARILGKRVGRQVLLLDALKGTVPVLISVWLMGRTNPYTAGVAFAAVLGHCFPVYFGLRGGKGAATAAGVMIPLEWVAGVSAVASFVVAKKLTRRASVGSLLGASVGAGLTVALNGEAWPSAGAVAILALVFLRHLGNLRRLIAGTEPPS